MTDKGRKLAPWLNTFAKLSGAAFSFVLLIILARNMSPVDFADFSVLLAWIALATALAGYSMPLVLVRYVALSLAEDRPGEAKGVIFFALLLTTSSSMLLMLLALVPIYFGWISLPRGLENYFFWILLLLPIGVLLTVLSGFMQGLKRVIAAEILINVSRPVLVIVAVFYLWSTGETPITTGDAISLYLIVSIVVVVICIIFLGFRVPGTLIRSRSQFHVDSWLRSATGFMAVFMSSVIYERMDILIMSWFSSQEEVASYAVAARFSLTITAATIAITAVMAPYLAEKLSALNSGETKEVNQLLRQTARTMFILTIIALAVFILLGLPLLSLLGDYYRSAYQPLIILATGQVVAAFFGPSVSFSAFIGETRIAMLSMITAIGINAGLIVLLTPRFGANGTSIAMATGMVASAFIAHKLLAIKRQLGSSVFTL